MAVFISAGHNPKGQKDPGADDPVLSGTGG